MKINGYPIDYRFSITVPVLSSNSGEQFKIVTVLHILHVSYITPKQIEFQFGSISRRTPSSIFNPMEGKLEISMWHKIPLIPQKGDTLCNKIISNNLTDFTFHQSFYHSYSLKKKISK